MSSDIDIRKQFQEKFSDFKAEVPEDGWARLEESLNAVPPIAMKPRRGWRYAASAAAAVVVLLVGSLLFMNRPMDVPEPMLTDSTAPKPSSQQPAVPSAQSERLTAQAGESITQSRSALPTQRASALLVGETRTEQEIEMISPALIPEVEAPASAQDKVVNENVASLYPEEWDEDRIIASTKNEGMLIGYMPEEDERPILLAVTGRGGLSSYQQTVNTPMTLRTASAAESLTEESAKNLFATQSLADNVSETEHDQPVSFGITVSKAIVDDLYIETGLVYSYLYSKVRNASSNFEVQETQRFHYLGVPLNVNYNVFSLNRFNVYASVGGMIEKDIHGKLRDERENPSVKENNISGEFREESISQRNPQISVNAGVGLSYPLYDNLKLYGKIGGSYYFDAKNEHKTIYSDRKIVMDLNVGIRYEFK